MGGELRGARRRRHAVTPKTPRHPSTPHPVTALLWSRHAVTVRSRPCSGHGMQSRPGHGLALVTACSHGQVTALLWSRHARHAPHRFARSRPHRRRISGRRISGRYKERLHRAKAADRAGRRPGGCCTDPRGGTGRRRRGRLTDKAEASAVADASALFRFYHAFFITDKAEASAVTRAERAVAEVGARSCASIYPAASR